MKTRHTKGQWVIMPYSGNDGSITIYQDGNFDKSWIADAKMGHVGPEELKETIANAKLIAAAPELLEALMFAVESMSMHDTMFNKALMVAKNAIKKATL